MGHGDAINSSTQNTKPGELSFRLAWTREQAQGNLSYNRATCGMWVGAGVKQ